MPSEVAQLAIDLVGVTRSRAGARHLMTNAAVAKVANDPRLLEIARRWLGSDAVPYRARVTGPWLASGFLAVRFRPIGRCRRSRTDERLQRSRPIEERRRSSKAPTLTIH